MDPLKHLYLTEQILCITSIVWQD